jgi:hypothetical protein
MRYMMLIHTPETAVADAVPAAATAMSADYAAYTQAMIKAGIYKGGDRLQPAGTAACVRFKEGQTEVLDGPYADSKEQFGGYYEIEVASLEEAVSWAARCPAAQRGTVEVRQIWEITGR